MFLENDIIGGNEPIATDTTIIQDLPTLSHTGHFERRALIRKLGAQVLVRDHNTLVNKIMGRGSILPHEKNIILSMEQEGVRIGGEFYGKIQENEGTQRVSHQEGMGRYNQLQGNTDILRGETRLRMWSLL